MEMIKMEICGQVLWHRVICLLALTGLLACDPAEALKDAGGDVATKDVPGVDGAGDAGHAADGALDAGATCACDQTTCGKKTCGRSDCGFPCGVCEVGQWCSSGSCTSGPPPGHACLDVLGGVFYEGQQGFRSCPTDATKIQRCTCAGTNPSTFIGCESECITPCHSQVECGSERCGPLSYCTVCEQKPGAMGCASRIDDSGGPTCEVNSTSAQFNCDDDSDCGPGGACMTQFFDVAVTSCKPAYTQVACGLGMGVGAIYQTCRDDSECGCGTCQLSPFVDQKTSTGYSLGICVEETVCESGQYWDGKACTSNCHVGQAWNDGDPCPKGWSCYVPGDAYGFCSLNCDPTAPACANGETCRVLPQYPTEGYACVK